MDHSTTPQDTPLKFCPKCSEWKPATEEYFDRRRASRDGLCSQCKPCRSEYNRVHRANNREHYIEYDRSRYVADKERHRERRKAYYVANRARKAAYYQQWSAANRERESERGRAYRAANQEQTRERRRAWQKSNPERVRAISNRYRSLKRNAAGDHTSADVALQYKRQKGRCYYCSIKVGKTYQVDHVVPLSRGGSNGPENLVIACPPCNRSKNDKLPHEWVRGGRLL